MISTGDDRSLARDFRLLAAGQSFSWLGNGFQPVALAVAVITTGGNASQLGVVLASSIVGRLIFSLLGGVWADRLQPQTVMIGSDLVRFAAVSGMAAMFATHHRSIWLLSLLALITAAAGAFFMPAMVALKPMIVRGDRLRSANATLSLLQTLSGVVGPATAGLVVAAWGAPAGFSVNAMSFLVSAGSLVLIKARVVRQERSGMVQELREGWAEVKSRDWLLMGLLASTAYHVANGAVLVLGPVIALERLGGSRAVGVIAAAEGLGGFLGAAVALRVKPRRPLFSGWLAVPLMSVWVLSYVTPGVLIGVCIGAVIGYAGLIFFDVGWETAIQENVPHDRLARVGSWDTLASFIGMPLGNAVAGPLANAVGINKVLVGCAAVLFIAGIAPLTVKGTRTLTRQSG